MGAQLTLLASSLIPGSAYNVYVLAFHSLMVAPITIVAVSIFTQSTVFFESVWALACMSINTYFAHLGVAYCVHSGWIAAQQEGLSSLHCNSSQQRTTSDHGRSNGSVRISESNSSNTTIGSTTNASSSNSSSNSNSSRIGNSNSNSNSNNRSSNCENNSQQGPWPEGWNGSHVRRTTNGIREEEMSEARLMEEMCERELPILMSAGVLGGIMNILPWAITVTLLPNCIQNVYSFLTSSQVILSTSLWHSLPAMILSCICTTWVSYDSFFVAASIPSGDAIWIACVVYFDLFFLFFFTVLFIVITVVLYVLADDGADDGADAYPSAADMDHIGAGAGGDGAAVVAVATSGSVVSDVV